MICRILFVVLMLSGCATSRVVAPIYPEESRALKEEGTVLLRVVVEASGKPSDVRVERSSGSPSLDASAVQAVTQWVFKPAMKGREPVQATALVPVVFSLKNDASGSRR